MRYGARTSATLELVQRKILFELWELPLVVSFAAISQMVTMGHDYWTRRDVFGKKEARNNAFAATTS